MTGLPPELRDALTLLAEVPALLVVCDYDGTLAPIVADPDRAFPRPESIAALRSLARRPGVTAAVVSGRALSDLRRLSGLDAEPGVVLVGSHGAELDTDLSRGLPPEAARRLGELRRALGELVAGRDGVGLEVKPGSVAVHVRRAAPEVGAAVLDAVRAGPARWPEVSVTEGKAVIELAVVRTDKGDALELLRRRCGAGAVLFVGDDVTDERAFARLSGADVGVKVGEGDTTARYRVLDAAEVTTLLEVLLNARR